MGDLDFTDSVLRDAHRRMSSPLMAFSRRHEHSLATIHARHNGACKERNSTPHAVLQTLCFGELAAQLLMGQGANDRFKNKKGTSDA